jgi:hypothetical protein
MRLQFSYLFVTASILLSHLAIGQARAPHTIADLPHEEVFQGHYQGRGHSAELGGAVELDLILRRQNDQIFAVMFEKLESGSEFGSVYGVEMLGNGTLAMSKMFIDGQTPLPRSYPTATRQVQAALVRYPGRRDGIVELTVIVPEIRGQGGYSYVLTRSYTPTEWMDYDPNSRFNSRALAPFEGSASTLLNGSSLRFQVSRRSTSEVVLPCGVSGGTLELTEQFPGIYGARLESPNLLRETGISLNPSLYAFVIPLRKSNSVETYHEYKLITFHAESCSRTTQPGQPLPTQVITFKDSRF